MVPLLCSPGRRHTQHTWRSPVTPLIGNAPPPPPRPPQLPTRRRAYYVAEGPSHKAAAAPSHQQPGNEGEGLQPAPSGTLDASEADGGPHPAALAGTSGSAAGKLARSSPGAASDASSAASSGLGASLLRRPSQQRTARQPPEQQQPDAPQQPPALRHSVPLRTRLRRWCMRYFVTPVFG
mgnify:CR=1 FL=1